MTDARSSDPAQPAGHPELVELEIARTPFEARVIAIVLEDAGIPAYVAGELLTDEFAVSQRMMNLQGVRVQVPQDRLGDARAALVAARKRGEAMREETGGEPS